MQKTSIKNRFDWTFRHIRMECDVPYNNSLTEHISRWCDLFLVSIFAFKLCHQRKSHVGCWRHTIQHLLLNIFWPVRLQRWPVRLQGTTSTWKKSSEWYACCNLEECFADEPLFKSMLWQLCSPLKGLLAESGWSLKSQRRGAAVSLWVDGAVAAEAPAGKGQQHCSSSSSRGCSSPALYNLHSTRYGPWYIDTMCYGLPTSVPYCCKTSAYSSVVSLLMSPIISLINQFFDRSRSSIKIECFWFIANELAYVLHLSLGCTQQIP